MAPLPCSPVSNSTASESQSNTASEDSDDSLITPRPGPADPTQRTQANLSRPSVPYFSTSPDSFRVVSGDGLPRRPFSYGATSSSSPKTSAISTGDLPHVKHPSPDGRRTINFAPPLAALSRQDCDSGQTSSSMLDAHDPSSSGQAHDLRIRRTHGAGDNCESSADENTAIMQKSRSVKGTYGTAKEDDPSDLLADVDDSRGSNAGPASLRRKKSGRSVLKMKDSGVPSSNAGGATDISAECPPEDTWLHKLANKYGSVELENKGSVARDHLALERTFLAWLRTSLSFASIGIAITQLFRLNTSISSDSESVHSTVFAVAAKDKLRRVGQPLGATFIGISILILLLGFHRYFESQHYVIQGKFPASRGSIVLVSIVAGVLIITSFVVVIAVAPNVIDH